jgi:hypothetical protein
MGKHGGRRANPRSNFSGGGKFFALLLLVLLAYVAYNVIRALYF